MKSYFSSRTMWAGFGVVVLGGLQAIFQDAPLPPHYQGVITAVIGAGIMWLRSITTQAVGMRSEG